MGKGGGRASCEAVESRDLSQSGVAGLKSAERMRDGVDPNDIMKRVESK
jgi:hypothetical protein